MTCPKCHGLQVKEWARDEEQGVAGQQRHCLNCGKIDAVGPVRALTAGDPGPPETPDPSPPQSLFVSNQNKNNKTLALGVEGLVRRPPVSPSSPYLQSPSVTPPTVVSHKDRNKIYQRRFYWKSKGFSEAEIRVKELAYVPRKTARGKAMA